MLLIIQHRFRYQFLPSFLPPNHTARSLFCCCCIAILFQKRNICSITSIIAGKQRCPIRASRRLPNALALGERRRRMRREGVPRGLVVVISKGISLLWHCSPFWPCERPRASMPNRNLKPKLYTIRIHTDTAASRVNRAVNKTTNQFCSSSHVQFMAFKGKVSVKKNTD